MFFKTIFLAFVLCVVVFVGLDIVADPVLDFAAQHKESVWASEVYYNMAGLAFLSLKWDLATIIYKRAIKLFPHHRNVPLAYYRIGKCYQKMGNFSKAVTFFEYFLKKFPNNPMAPNVELTVREIKDFDLAAAGG